MSIRSRLTTFQIVALVLILMFALIADAKAGGAALSGQLRVLSFNTWLLKFPIGLESSSHNQQRRNQMIQRIGEMNLDVVGFQEVWDSSDREALINGLKPFGFTYSAYNEDAFGVTSGDLNPFNRVLGRTMGNGLLILSKLPMRGETQSLVFSNSTRKVSLGMRGAVELDEVFVNKGAIRTEIQVPGLGWVPFYNTHLGALTFDHERNAYAREGELSRHAEQLSELVAWINETRRRLEVVVFADLNMSPMEHVPGQGYSTNPSSAYLTIQAPMVENGEPGGPDLLDAFGKLHDRFDGTPEWTFDAENNPYVSDGFFGHSEVIDYVFISNKSRMSVNSAEVVFGQPDPTLASAVDADGKPLPGFLSDHYGVLVELGLPDRTR